MTPTDENIREVVQARKGSITAAGGDVEWVIGKAIYYVQRSHHPAESAQQAVTWAITDIPNQPQEEEYF